MGHAPLEACLMPNASNPSPIAIVAKTFGVSHDTMLNYLSQQEVTEYFGGKKTTPSYFSIIQVVDNFFSI